METPYVKPAVCTNFTVFSQWIFPTYCEPLNIMGEMMNLVTWESEWEHSLKPNTVKDFRQFIFSIMNLAHRLAILPYQNRKKDEHAD